MNEQPKRVRVVKTYHSAYPDPLRLLAEDTVTIGEKESEWEDWLWCTDSSGKSGWIPESFIRREGDYGTMITDYDATELTVEEGQVLEVVGQEAGWYWCTTPDGQTGWVPHENVAEA